MLRQQIELTTTLSAGHASFPGAPDDLLMALSPSAAPAPVHELIPCACMKNVRGIPLPCMKAVRGDPFPLHEGCAGHPPAPS